MVAPLVLAAGIGAVGSIAGAAAGGKGAKKAAKYQRQTAREQIAAAERNRDFQYGLNQPVINQGTAADDRIAALLNLGGNTANARAGFDAYRKSTGYDFRVDEGMDAINTNAYARGMGDSGATLKALASYGQNIASDEFSKYLSQLGGVSASGANARGLVAGVGTNAVNQFMGASQNAANASSNAALARAAMWGQAIQGVGNAVGYAIGNRSSYAPAYGGGG